MVWTCLKAFKGWRRKKARKGLEKILPFEGQRLDDLIALLSDKRFSLFLEYLELTISEKLVMLSSIELLDEEQRKQAVKMQNQMRGIRMVIDFATELVERSKALANEEEQSN